ncbi:MAG: DUF11 domain-containing protein [Caldilineaceae bacterium]|nr:DUF11 domain-containing protein [Caldilineaceae bacterium]
MAIFSGYRQRGSRHGWQAVFGALFISILYGIGVPTAPAWAQVNPVDPTFCYTVADNGGSTDPDFLIRIDRSAGTSTTVIGPTGTFNVEGIDFIPGGATLYAMNGNQLGTLDLVTAAFTPIGVPLGTATGSLGLRSLNDVDGLAYDGTSNLIYGAVARSTANDLLIRIDPATGALVPFAPGVDYLVITVTGSPNNFHDIDDMAFDPVTGILYGISDNGARGELVTINPATGVATYIADFSIQDEVEGLSFFNDGELYASSGIPNDPTSNRLYRVDKTTGVLTDLGSLLIDGHSDFEAIGCLTATAFLAVEKTTNGEDADLPTGPHLLIGAPVTWAYTIRNTGVVPVDTIALSDDQLPPGAITCPAFPQPNQGLQPNEAIICTASGLATAGQYTNLATVTGIGRLPTGDAVALTSSDRSHYLGVQPDLAITKTDGGITTQPGNTLIYTLIYSNVGTIDATGVVITEVVPAHTTFSSAGSSVGWVCTPSNNAGSTCTLPIGTLAPGQQSAINFAVSLISSFPVGVNLLTNTAVIQDDGTHGADADPTNNQSTDTTPVLAAPELEADKMADWRDTGIIGGIDPGELITYTIVVRNVGNQMVIDVALIDTPDVNSTLVNGSVQFTNGTGVITQGNTPGDLTIAATIASIEGGGEARLTYQATINQPLPIGVDRIINHALISNTIEVSTTVPALATPDLVIAKSDGGISTSAGDEVVYTLTYANTGTRNATGVVIREVVPANSTFVAAASAPTLWSCPDGSSAGTVCMTTIGTLLINATGTATFAVTSNRPLPAGVEQLENVVRISDDGTNGDDPTPENNRATDLTPVNAAPDLMLGKDDGNRTSLPGATVVYSLTYTNVGSQAATGVVITETVPLYTRFTTVGSTPGWNCTPNGQPGSRCTLAIGSLAVGATAVVRFALQLEMAFPAGVELIENQAQIGDDGRNGVDPTPQNNQASDTTPVDAAPDLAIAKDDDGIRAEPDGLIVYHLDYSNVGNQGAAGVVITETVPAHTTFVPASSTAGWSCTPTTSAGSTCTIAMGAVAVGQSGLVNFAVRVVDRLPAGVEIVSNTAQIADDGRNGIDLLLDNNQATDTTPVDATPNLIVEKIADVARVRPGDTIHYTLVYTNAGNQDATGIVLQETLPEWTTFLAAASTPGWHCAFDTGSARTLCTLAVGSLAAGQQATFYPRFAVTVDANVPEQVTAIVNVVLIHDDGSNGVPPTGLHTDIVETPLNQPTSLEPSIEPPSDTHPAPARLYLPLVTQ